MNITSKIEHKGSISADVSYASFNWSLCQWSLLYDDYKAGVTSPEFEIMQGNDCKCVLTFYAKHRALYNPKNYNQRTQIVVEFTSELRFHSLQAKVFIDGKNMHKLCAVESLREITVGRPLVLTFYSVLEEEIETWGLVDDTLKLVFELYIVKAIIKSPVSTNTWDSNFGTMSRDKLKDLFKTSEFCDVTFIVQEKSLPAHKLILAAHSDVFRVMFKSQKEEENDGTIEIDDVDAKVFKAFLRYMYTGEVKEMEELVTDLIIVADKYKVTDLVKACETYMSAHIQIDNATKYVLTAHHLHFKNLEEEAVKFIKRNTQILADPAEFKLLSEYPCLITRIFS